jgi:histidinol-phosphate/aromatic aminotransferase/cobyric acid decarboxylase-like protein
MPVCRSSTPLTSVAAVGVSVTSVPLQEWSHDLETTAAVDADKGFIRNSHDPSGTVVTSEALGSFLERCRARLVVGALRTVRREVRCDHERLRDAFVAAGFGVVPSQANFVLVLAAEAIALWTRLQEGGVSVRLGGDLGVPGTVHVSVPAATGSALLECALGSDRGRQTARAAP